jgi:hypothetical protein
MTIEKRELYETFDRDGRQWRIGKFDAMTGTWMAYRVANEVLPILGVAEMIGVPVRMDAKPMGKSDFLQLQRECLAVCAEMLPAGPTPVLNAEGTFAVQGLEYDAQTVGMLTVRALVWNLRSFFGANVWSSAVQAFQDMKQPAA